MPGKPGRSLGGRSSHVILFILILFLFVHCSDKGCYCLRRLLLYCLRRLLNSIALGVRGGGGVSDFPAVSDYPPPTAHASNTSSNLRLQQTLSQITGKLPFECICTCSNQKHFCADRGTCRSTLS